MVSAMLRAERRRIVKLALAQRWPIAAGVGEFAEDGVLLSYGADNLANYRRAAYYVDRILKGAKPGDLPHRAADEIRVGGKPKRRSLSA
jgi:putative ABC transport system substrate-binding protein